MAWLKNIATTMGFTQKSEPIARKLTVQARKERIAYLKKRLSAGATIKQVAIELGLGASTVSEFVIRWLPKYAPRGKRNADD